MADVVFYLVLILGFIFFEIASLVWPQTIRRFNFGLMSLVLPVRVQVLLTRMFGGCSILFSLVILVGLLRSLF